METNIRLSAIDGKLELASFSATASLTDLAEGLESARSSDDLRTRACRGCGECCSDLIPVLAPDLFVLAGSLGVTREELFSEYLSLPARPVRAQRERGIEDLARQFNITERAAAWIYEFNQANPITFRRKRSGECVFLADNLCTIYADRPFICRLYVCNMGDNLAVLHEAIVTQGVWHSYVDLGWLSREDIPHNPFIKAASYGAIALSEFDAAEDGSLEQLFSV